MWAARPGKIRRTGAAPALECQRSPASFASGVFRPGGAHIWATGSRSSTDRLPALVVIGSASQSRNSVIEMEVVVVTVSWTQPAQELVDRLEVGMDALWSLIYAAQTGALSLALVEPLDEDLSLTEAGMDLADALGELEWVRPELTAGSVAVDLGPAPLDDVSACREAIAGLLAAAVDVVVGLLREQGEQLDTPDLLAVARVAHLVSSAYTQVTGRLP